MIISTDTKKIWANSYKIPPTLNTQNRHIHGDKILICGCQEVEEGEQGVIANCLEILYGAMKKFWKQIVVIVYNTVNLLNATELYP